MKLLLIRHGATPGTQAHLYCGATDVPLSEAGREALRGIQYPEERRYVTSGMRRTNETMELLYPGVMYETMPDLREMDFGDFEMKSYEMLKEDPAYIEWITGDNAENICPGGESGKQALARAMKALQQIVAENTDTAVVTHGGVIAGAMEAWFPECKLNRYAWQPRPGEGYKVEFEGGVPAGYRAL